MDTFSAITSAAPKGQDDPPECAAAKQAIAAGAPISVVGSAPAQRLPAPVPASGGAPSPTATAGGTAPPTAVQTPTAAMPRTAVPAPTGVTPTGTPVPVNQTGFAAVQTGDGQVQLTWQPVSAASYYVVFGPGSVSGGMKVSGATTYAVLGVPAGLQTFTVASYYDAAPASTSNSAGPNAVSTPAAAFPTASVTVTATNAAAPAPAPATASASATAPLTSFDPDEARIPVYNVPSARVGRVADNMPAKAAGIQKGDIITKIDGKEITEFLDIASSLEKVPANTVNVTVNRNGKPMDFRVTPTVIEEKDIFGEPFSRKVLGIERSDEVIKKRQSPLKAMLFHST